MWKMLFLSSIPELSGTILGELEMFCGLGVEFDCNYNKTLFRMCVESCKMAFMVCIVKKCSHQV